MSRIYHVDGTYRAGGWFRFRAGVCATSAREARQCVVERLEADGADAVTFVKGAVVKGGTDGWTDGAVLIYEATEVKWSRSRTPAVK